MRSDFTVFILTHGRADNVITYRTLKRLNYTGDVYLVIDNEDKTADRYRELYGDKVLMFDKLAVSKTFDTADNFDMPRKQIVYARNVCFELAKQMGYKYFLELDDDYDSFQWRYVEGKKLKITECFDLDSLFESMVEFLESSGAMTVALAQGGDFIGGVKGGNYKKSLHRKAMNTFFCSTERPFKFVGRINEDVNTYTSCGMRGDLLFTVTMAMITQFQTQSNKGGMTDTYIDSGTYLKSFYSVIYCPSCVKVSVMGDKHKRLHHKINWNHCVPHIIDEKWKKV